MSTKIHVYLYKDNPNGCWKGQNEICKNTDYISVVQGEAGSETLHFHLLLSQSIPLDLMGKNVTFFFTKPDGEKIFLPVDVSEETATKGLALVTLTAQSTAVSGLTKHGEIRITEADGSILKFQTPNIYIASSNTEGVMESTSEFHALDVALSKIQPYLSSMEKALSTMQDTLNQISNTAQKAEESAAFAAQKVQESASAKESAAQSAASAQSACTLAQQNALSASNSAATASSAALAEINKQKGQEDGLASLGANSKINERMEYSHLDALPSVFPPQAHTHSYSDLTGAAPFFPIVRTHVDSMSDVKSEGHFLITGADTSGTPTNTNYWLVDSKQEGWGMVAVAYGTWDAAIYISYRGTKDNGQNFYWNSWRKIS